jgi:hypothetical protein
MIAPIKSRIRVAGRGSIYHLKITLAEVKPPIWRRLRVPGEANLGWLHAVIQVAMGWTNSHLHQFTSGGTVYSDPGFDLDEFEDDPKVFDERQATLQKIAPKLKSVLVYEYDFGDSWDHFITVEKILPPDPAVAPGAEVTWMAHAPVRRRDCGVKFAYADVKPHIRRPGHVQRQSNLGWLGRPFDPEVFNRDSTNKHLRRLRWPKTTESQLRGVLMRRDGFKA